MRLGSFSIRLRDTSLIDELSYFGTIVVTPQRILNPDRVLDAGILDLASYSGILREKSLVSAAGKPDELSLAGHGPGGWLADEEGKGYVLETERAFSADTFGDVLNRSGSAPFGLLRDDAGALITIQVGTIFSVAGTYTGTHKFQNQRDVIRYVVEVFGAEYRINPDFTIDAGLESQLFVTTPTAIAVRREALGDDPNFDGIPLGVFQTVRDVKGYASRVLLLAEGTGGALITGSANDVSVPYVDPFDNAVVRVAVISEAETESGNADARAQIDLDARGDTRDAVTLSPADFEVDGVVAVGDTIFVYDPEGELVDTANEARFRGRALPAAAIRCLGISWPVTEGMGVYYRKSAAGASPRYIDLSDFVVFESGAPTLEVGAVPRSTKAGDPQAIAGRIFTPPGGDTAVPGVPAHTATPWATSSYVDGEGRTRAQISVSWSQPLNTDSSTIVDGAYYTIRWRRTGETDYQYSSVGFDRLAFLLQDLAPGVTYEISVEAVDMAVPPNRSGFGTDESVIASADTVAPSTPAAPTVAASVIALQITHELGKATGGTFNLETDLDHLNIYIDPTSGFTPSAANLVGKIPANAGHLTLGIKVIGVFPIPDAVLQFVKVTAVDKAGNESTASGQSSASADLVDTAQIANLAVTTALIGALQVTDAKIADLDGGKIQANTITAAEIAADTITAAEIAADTITAAEIAADTITSGEIKAGTIEVLNLMVGSFDNLAPNPTFQSDLIDGVDDPHAYNAGTGGTWSSDGTKNRSGQRCARFDVNSQTATAELEIGGAGVATDRHVSAIRGDEFVLELFMRYVDAAPTTAVNLKVSYRNAFGSELSNTTGPDISGSLTTTHQKFTLSVTVPDTYGIAYVVPSIIFATGSGSTVALLYEDLYFRRRIGTAVIEDLAVETAKIALLAVDTAQIADAAITNLKVNDLNAVKITAGVLAAGRVDADNIDAGTLASARIVATLTSKTLSGSNTLIRTRTGSAGTPGIAFNSDTDTGFYLASTSIRHTVSGALQWHSSTTKHITQNHIDPSSAGALLDLGTTAAYYDDVVASNFPAPSDATLKTQIEDSPLGLDFIRALTPRRFKLLDTKDTAGMLDWQRRMEAKGEEYFLEVEANGREFEILAADELGEPLLDAAGEPIILETVPNPEAVRLDAERKVLQAERSSFLGKPGTRWHYGLVADEVAVVLAAAGQDFAGYIDPAFADPTNTEAKKALRYHQFFAPIIAALQEVDARITTLEGM